MATDTRIRKYRVWLKTISDIGYRSYDSYVVRSSSVVGAIAGAKRRAGCHSQATKIEVHDGQHWRETTQ
jgi:hypothetical protein